jgi:hypothetical protein
VETEVKALLTSVDDTSLKKVRPYDIQKSVKTLRVRKACELDGIPKECFRHLPRPLAHLTH